MVQFTTKLHEARLYGVLLVCIMGIMLIFRHELALLFVPDPPIEKIYQYSFDSGFLRHADAIIHYEGFSAKQQGLHLAPDTSGGITLSFTKERGQGCLLRVWFYGDGGAERPNAIKVSVNGGKSFHQVAGSGNHLGSVFDLTSYLGGSNVFQLLFEAHNHAPYAVPVLDSIEVLIARENAVKPVLPDLTRILGIILVFALPLFLIFSKDTSNREKVTRVLCVLIMLLAVYLRWNELVNMAGTVIDGDARGYYRYAEKMDLFSTQGFYSAQFEKREPLYILMVKLFFIIFGVSGTHLRLVSFVFSLVTIYLTYKIGKEWFNEIVGLTASFILAVQPYLIQLSVRGLRAEWFATLVLLFIYYGYVKRHMGAPLRTVITGLVIGSMLLTRSESLFMVVIIMMAYPVIAQSKWNYKMVFTGLLLGITLLIPHQYGIYKKHGDPFYTVNQYARFYANREFAGQPGFPTNEDIATKGMYTGRKITPLEYYFSLHSPWQLVRYSIVGFAKIHLTMPLHFATGKGTLSSVRYAFGELQAKMNGEQLVKSSRQLMAILQKHFWGYALTASILLSFLVGIVLIAFSPYRILLLYMVFFQVQTSFVAYLGIDSRLTVHSYPLIALCCGYCIWRMTSGLRRRFEKPVVSTTVSSN
jgi:4-amino-4-deoxy-L-arabinose transferase-like glycosyltransferase